GDMAFNGASNPNQIMRFLQDDTVSNTFPTGSVYETGSGEVDLVKIFNSALSADDVASLMPVKGDINGDGIFNAADVADLEYALAHPTALGNWSMLGDFNGDGLVTTADLQAMLLALKAGQGSTLAAPEPGSDLLALLGAAGLIGLSRRRRWPG